MKFFKPRGGDSREEQQEHGEAPLMKNIAYTYACMTLWITISSTVIIFNKYILFYAAFPYPIALTSLHMGFSSILAWILVKTGLVEVPSIPKELYLRGIIPIGALFALVLWLSNAAYLYLSVSFIQMLKASLPMVVFVVGIFFATESYSHPKALNMVIICIGIVIASAGEVQFIVIGVLMQLGALVAEAIRITLIQILLQKKGVKLSPIGTLYYIAPCCLLFLLPLFFIVESGRIMKSEINLVGMAPLLLLNASFAFGLNLSVFLLIGNTSALTMNIAGVVKDWLLIVLSVIIYGSTVTKVNLLGYGIAFLGVCWYNHHQILAVKQKDIGEQKSPEKSQSGDVSPFKPAHYSQELKTPLLSIYVEGPPGKKHSHTNRS